MIWTLLSIAWPLALLVMIVRGQFKEKDIPGKSAPIVLGATGIGILVLNSWWFRLSSGVLGYLVVSALIGIASGYLRGRFARIYVSAATGSPVRFGGLPGAGFFVGGMALHYLAELAFAPAAPVLPYGSALTINIYIAATLGAAGIVYRGRARRLTAEAPVSVR